MVNDRIGALEDKLEARSLQRDNDIAGVREDIAAIAESLRAAAASNGELARRIAILESVRQPGLLAYLGPAVGVAVALGSLGAFVLDNARTAITGEFNAARVAITAELAEAKQGRHDIEDKQYVIHGDQKGQAAELRAMQRQIDAVDTRGVRAKP